MTMDPALAELAASTSILVNPPPITDVATLFSVTPHRHRHQQRIRTRPGIRTKAVIGHGSPPAFLPGVLVVGYSWWR
jgi:hypothetical protein